jgi:hypothetical protein
MATYTSVDLNIPQATLLADLNGISVDLGSAKDMAQLLKDSLDSGRPKWEIVEPYSIAIAVRYSRPFVTGVRTRLGEEDLTIFSPEQRDAHERLRAYRDKHVAHSVNEFEENLPCANYCEERVQVEGITSIGCSHSRVAGLSPRDIGDIVELSTLMLNHVETRMAQEQTRLLSIVRGMPLDTVLAGGQKIFVVGRKTKIDKRRKSHAF